MDPPTNQPSAPKNKSPTRKLSIRQVLLEDQGDAAGLPPFEYENLEDRELVPEPLFTPRPSSPPPPLPPLPAGSRPLPSLPRPEGSRPPPGRSTGLGGGAEGLSRPQPETPTNVGGEVRVSEGLDRSADVTTLKPRARVDESVPEAVAKAEASKTKMEMGRQQTVDEEEEPGDDEDVHTGDAGGERREEERKERRWWQVMCTIL
ncbi:hypothetical protein BU16DRAFT_576319 [Lophium mytilinum]|uniref:Uncharacterized protein n=1 Tax=Lophium mytilinum TaxID=390894 RepID=A0A6A6RFP9_9PEZI|nr:hypothetical protein BU16DRAFT_576319 [Lophium mytilinum]